MKFNLALLVLFTAIMSFACVRYYSRDANQGQLGIRANPLAPITIQRTDSIFNGQCEARLTFDRESGDLKTVETTDPCQVTKEQLFVNGKPILDLSGSIAFEGSCKRCYPSGDCVVYPFECPKR